MDTETLLEALPFENRNTKAPLSITSHPDCTKSSAASDLTLINNRNDKNASFNFNLCTKLTADYATSHVVY